MSIRIFSLLVFVIIGACMPLKNYNLPGRYVHKESSLFVRCCHPFDSFILGNEVNIYADSTFRYESCSSMAAGRWRVKQDSLVLTTESNIVKKDSSHLQQGRFVYAIETNGELHRILKPKRKTLRDYLVKADPGTIEK